MREPFLNDFVDLLLRNNIDILNSSALEIRKLFKQYSDYLRQNRDRYEELHNQILVQIHENKLLQDPNYLYLFQHIEYQPEEAQYQPEEAQQQPQNIQQQPPPQIVLKKYPQNNIQATVKKIFEYINSVADKYYPDILIKISDKFQMTKLFKMQFKDQNDLVIKLSLLLKLKEFLNTKKYQRSQNNICKAKVILQKKMIFIFLLEQKERSDFYDVCFLIFIFSIMDLKKMIVTSEQVLEIVYTPILLSVGEFLQVKFIDKYNDWQTLYDSLIMFGSLFSSKTVNNLFVSKIVGQFENYYAVNLSAYLTQPVLTYFVYNWGYDRYFKKSFKYYKEKIKTEQIVIPILISAISKAIGQSVIAIITGGNQVSYYGDL